MSILDTISQSRRALARAITLVEVSEPSIQHKLAKCSPRRATNPGSPHVIGITGPPGAGKSTFVDQLIAKSRAAGLKVAVVAVDPSSPFSGGAILGDRIRMDAHAGDPGVYIRSLSARGAGGGLSRACSQIVDLLDLAGFDRILVETVGVGQGELAVLEVADSVLVVLTPESGDTVQTMKAGLLEVADVFVVNKADRPGADALCRELELSVHLDTEKSWQAPVFMATASEGKGIEPVLAALETHLSWLQASGKSAWMARRSRGRVSRCLELVEEWARQQALKSLQGELLEKLETGESRPEEAAWLLINTLK
jgi:LAO/AO transport system kinase